MILAVDAGNSRIKWGLWDARWLEQGSLATADANALEQHWRDMPRIERVIACNVAGAAVEAQLETWAVRRSLKVRWARSQSTQCGVRNGYDDPEQLGADRWCAMIGGHHHCGAPLLVVYAGTAVTINVLDRGAEFIGGLILPGLSLMSASLARGTAQLPAAEGTFQVFPRVTVDAIASGAIQAACGAVERMHRNLVERAGAARIALSGGAGRIIEAHLGLPATYLPELVLEGLRVIDEQDRAP